MNPNYSSKGSNKDKLIEEIGELLQEVSKAERFGLFNFHPEQPTKLNCDRILEECEDLRIALNNYQKEICETIKLVRYKE